jgi:multidrug transporter EmrE-like cation transporter
MRKILVVLGIIFTILSIVFSFLPMDTIAFLPIGLALVFGLLLLKKSNENQKILPSILLLLCVLSSVFVLGKTLLIKDEVEKDVKFEQQKVEENKEAKKELENLEKDLQ